MTKIIFALFSFSLISCAPKPAPETILRTEKLYEFNGGFSSRVWDIQINPGTKEDGLLYVYTAAANDEKYQTVITRLDGSSLGSKNFVAFGNPIHGFIETAIAVDQKLKGRLIFKKVRMSDLEEHPSNIDLLKDQSSEPIFDPQGRQIGQVFPADRNGTVAVASDPGMRPTRIHTLANGDVYLLIRADDSLKLLKFSHDGLLLWKKLIVPKVRDSGRIILFEEPQLSISSNGSVAIAANVYSNEMAAFKRLHGIDCQAQDIGQVLTQMVLILDPDGNTIQIEKVAPIGSVILSWMDTNVLVAVSSEMLTVLTINHPISEHRLPMGSQKFSVSAVQPVSPTQLLIGGSIGFKQAATFSVTSPGKAFIGLYDINQRRFIDRRLLGNHRNNSVTALENIGNGKFLMATHEDGPITHDDPNDRYSKSVLYQIEIN